MPQSQIHGSIMALDHLVLTVRDIPKTLDFYTEVLGMEKQGFDAADGTRRWAIFFGSQKFNLHQAGREFEPKSASPTPGSADLCLLTDVSLDIWQSHLAKSHIETEEGPVRRSGATGPLMSLYLRDPDNNLIEISQPVP